MDPWYNLFIIVNAAFICAHLIDLYHKREVWSWLWIAIHVGMILYLVGLKYEYFLPGP